MANLLRALLDSPSGVSNFERGLVPVQLAAGPGASPAASRSAAIFDTKRATQKDLDFHKEMSRLASFARIALPNAARHLEHYLEGGVMGRIGIDDEGNPKPDPIPLEVDVAAMLREIKGLQGQVDRSVSALRARLEGELAAGRRPSRLAGKSTLAGATGATSQDWFYALGRFTYAVRCEVDYASTSGPGKQARVPVWFQIDVDDFYDWDRDKVTLPIPHPDTGEEIVIHDKDMRRLHRVGIAREYPISGTAILARVLVPLKGKSSGRPSP